MATAKVELIVDHSQELSKTQQKRLENYKSLGTTSKSAIDKKKFDAKYNALQKRSLGRRKKLDQMDMYQQFTEILSIHSTTTLNPSNFLDYLASIITHYVGQNQTILISKLSSNRHTFQGNFLNITNIDMLIPFQAPRDQMSYILPNELKPQKDDTKSNDAIERHPINAAYAFGALPDQRLFSKYSQPYIMDETYRWTILHGTNLRPPPLVDRGGNERVVAHRKIIAAAILSDGMDTTYCIYGTRDGLFYNPKGRVEAKPVQLIEDRVDGMFRQNDYLFVVCHGPKLYNVSLTSKTKEIAVNKIFETKKDYDFCGFKAFVGGYYDAEKQIFIGANNEAEVYVFKNGKGIDTKFNDQFRKFRRKQLRLPKQDRWMTKGNLCYYDVDRNCVMYLGSKHVLRISMVTDKKGNYSPDMVKVWDIKWFLKGYNFECNHFLYIYHQKALVILKRVTSSAQYPYILKIYTEKSLRFE